MTDTQGFSTPIALPDLQGLLDSGLRGVDTDADVVVIDHRLSGPDAEPGLASLCAVTRAGRGGGAMIRITRAERMPLAAAITAAAAPDSPDARLVLLLDRANLDLDTLCQALEGAGDRLGTVDVLAFAGAGDPAYTEALLRHVTNEAAIVVRAAGRDGPLSVDRPPPSRALRPGSIAGGVFSTSVGQFLGALARHGATEPAAGPIRLHWRLGAVSPGDPPAEGRPLFTVVTRTQGRRLDTLAAVMDALAAQACDDFEHLVVGHDLDAVAGAAIAELVAAQPPAARARIRLCPVEGGNRTVPLNHGFLAARGLYAVILDDDDIVLPHWLETFRALARQAPGRLLRAGCVKQEFERTSFEGRPGVRAVGGLIHDYAGPYDHLEHFGMNRTPAMSIAFPTFLFAQNGIRFDECLSTTEDWDAIVRCAGLVGVAGSAEVTSIYRWWTNAESSRTDHAPDEWRANNAMVQERIASRPYLLPAEAVPLARALSALAARNARWATDTLERLRMWEVAFFADKIFHFAEGGLPEHDLLDAAGGAEARMARRAAIVAASGLFDSAFYLDQNTDVGASGIDPLTHFVRWGSAELRNPGPDFDAVFYTFTNPDVRRARIEPLFHYIAHGRAEGRFPTPRAMRARRLKDCCVSCAGRRREARSAVAFQGSRADRWIAALRSR